jgi:hypothetical protein
LKENGEKEIAQKFDKKDVWISEKKRKEKMKKNKKYFENKK